MAIYTGRTREPQTGLPACPSNVRATAPPACCGTTYSMIPPTAQGLSDPGLKSWKTSKDYLITHKFQSKLAAG